MTLEALEPYRCPTSAGKQEDPQPLPYLQDEHYSGFDVNLEVSIRGKDMDKYETVTRTNGRNLYWSFAQMLAHHTVTGCRLCPGDLCGTGTISGKEPGSLGCMLEMSWNKTREVPLGQCGQTRHFLLDEDSVRMTGVCMKEGLPRVGFGECTGVILAAGSVLPPLSDEEDDEDVPQRDLSTYKKWMANSPPHLPQMMPAARAVDDRENSHSNIHATSSDTKSNSSSNAAGDISPISPSKRTGPHQAYDTNKETALYIPRRVSSVYGIISDLKLHGAHRSPCTWRVRIALAAKGLEYEVCMFFFFFGACVAWAYTPTSKGLEYGMYMYVFVCVNSVGHVTLSEYETCMYVCVCVCE